MVRHQQALNDIVAQDPNVDSFSSSVGGNAGSLNQGRLFMRLKPRSQRRLGVAILHRRRTHVIDRLRADRFQPHGVVIAGDAPTLSRSDAATFRLGPGELSLRLNLRRHACHNAIRFRLGGRGSLSCSLRF